jgi:hypothetical protein
MRFFGLRPAPDHRCGTKCSSFLPRACGSALFALVFAGVVAAGPVEDRRAAFTAVLDRAFLKAGVNVEVMRQGDRLILWGYWTRASVYAAVTNADLQLLAQAKAAGFRLVDFDDRGEDGHWIWNLAGPALPACDMHRRLCK